MALPFKLPLSRAALARVVPFAVFMLLLALRGALPADGSWGIDPRWVYGITVAVVGGLLAWWWREYGELSAQLLPNLRETALAVAVGVAVFWLWITLDAPWMMLGAASAAFIPVDAQGQLMWPLLVVRWVENPQFEAVVPQRVGLRAVVLSTFVFMLAHTLWLAAIIAGLAYAWLYVRTGKLWLPVIAHAVTNGVLGVWVVMTGNWAFW